MYLGVRELVMVTKFEEVWEGTVTWWCMGKELIQWIFSWVGFSVIDLISVLVDLQIVLILLQFGS